MAQTPRKPAAPRKRPATPARRPTATGKPATQRKRAATGDATDRAPRARTTRKRAPAARKAAAKAPKTARPPKPAKRTSSGSTPAAGKRTARPATKPSRRFTAAERERQFRLLLHTSCLKAGTAAAVTTLTSRVPLLNRMAPLVAGSLMQSLAVPRIQQQLVLDILELYGLELSDLERQGVILLATAANVGAQELSRRTVEDLVNRVGAPLGRPILDRMLPLTNLLAENAAAVASTYAVGRRAQALCRLSGHGARDLGELLGTITGIDQKQLVTWSAEAFRLAIRPFRAALLTLKPLG